MTWGAAIEAVGLSPAVGLRALSSCAPSYHAGVVASYRPFAGATFFVLDCPACCPSSAASAASAALSPALKEPYPRVVGAPPVAGADVRALIIGQDPPRLFQSVRVLIPAKQVVVC